MKISAIPTIIVGTLAVTMLSYGFGWMPLDRMHTVVAVMAGVALLYYASHVDGE